MIFGNFCIDLTQRISFEWRGMIFEPEANDVPNTFRYFVFPFNLLIFYRRTQAIHNSIAILFSRILWPRPYEDG